MGEIRSPKSIHRQFLRKHTENGAAQGNSLVSLLPKTSSGGCVVGKHEQRNIQHFYTLECLLFPFIPVVVEEQPKKNKNEKQLCIVYAIFMTHFASVLFSSIYTRVGVKGRQTLGDLHQPVNHF